MGYICIKKNSYTWKIKKIIFDLIINNVNKIHKLIPTGHGDLSFKNIIIKFNREIDDYNYYDISHKELIKMLKQIWFL